MVFRSVRRRGTLCAAASVACFAAHYAGAASLRIAAYNVDLDTGTTSPNSSISTALEDVGNETTYDGAHALDIIGLEETTSNTTSVSPIVNSLNTYYGAGTYAMSSYQASESGGDPTDGNGPNALIYNTTTLTLLNSVGIGTPGGSSNGEYRQVVRYEFQPVGGAASQDFYVYVQHAKSGEGSTSSSGNSAYRSEEASIVTADEASLPSGSSFIVMGDFNIDGTNEQTPSGVTPSYQKYLASGLVDPLNPTDASETYGSGTTAYSSILTESTQSTFEYRDDLQLDSTNIYNGTSTALTYIAASEHAFGNNGSVTEGSKYNTSSNNDPYKTVLYDATDHLPIVADYTITPIPEPASLAAMFVGMAALLVRRRIN